MTIRYKRVALHDYEVFEDGDHIGSVRKEWWSVPSYWVAVCPDYHYVTEDAERRADAVGSLRAHRDNVQLGSFGGSQDE